MALPILVRSLDIRLSRVHLYTTLFDRHLELHRHVRFVRVIDDYTRHWVKEGRSGSDTWVRGINRQWQRLSDLIKRRWTSARFDITSGVCSANEVAEALECSQIEQNIVAMRWIADHPSANSSVFFERARAHEFSAYEEVWGTISYIIENVTSAQTASDIKLVSLQIRGRQWDARHGDWIASCVWQVLNDIPSDSLHTLDITVGAHVPDEPHEGTVLGRIWSNLRHLNLKFDPTRGHHISSRAEGNELDFDSWMLAHPRLEHVDIGLPRSIFWLPSETALPNLTTVSLLECDADLIGAFLLRHGSKLVKLALPELATDDDKNAAIRPGLLLPKLRILLASSRVAIALVDGQHAPQLTQIEFLCALETVDWMIEAWVGLDFEATHRITCLHLDTHFEDLPLLMEKCSGKDFLSHAFPSLVELWLSGNAWHDYGRQEDPEDINVRYLQDVLQHLEALSCLRALRIWTASQYLLPFPVNDPLELSTGRAPRKLEYLTWDGSFTHAQTFRVVHQPIQYVARQTEDVQLPPILLRLQLLPASFLAHITDEGEWIEPGRDRWCKTIFDHTVSPPRLRPQAGLP